MTNFEKLIEECGKDEHKKIFFTQLKKVLPDMEKRLTQKLINGKLEWVIRGIRFKNGLH